jgi:predicted dienelactone hydrolase
MCPPGYPCVERSYTLQVYYPASVNTGGVAVNGASLARPITPYPVVVFAEGFNVMPATYLTLLSAWVEAGYVVASPIFPLTSSAGLAHYGVDLNNVGLADRYEDDLENQPGDLSAAITEMTTLGGSPSSLLNGEINASDVAVAGQSDGADATLALAANTCCVDSRIKAALVLSGAEFPGFQGPYFTTPAIPMLVTQGSADTVNPPSLSNQIYAAAPAPKAYLTLIGADHLAPYTGVDPYESVVAKVTIDFLNGFLKASPISLDQMTADGTVGGVAQIDTDLGSSG